MDSNHGRQSQRVYSPSRLTAPAHAHLCDSLICIRFSSCMRCGSSRIAHEMIPRTSDVVNEKPLYHASGCSYAFRCANAAGASGRNRTRNPRFTKPLRYRCATLAKPRPAVYHTWKQRNGSNISMMRQRERGKRTGHAPRSPRTMASSFARVSVSSLSAMVRFSLAARRRARVVPLRHPRCLR